VRQYGKETAPQPGGGRSAGWREARGLLVCPIAISAIERNGIGRPQRHGDDSRWRKLGARNDVRGAEAIMGGTYSPRHRTAARGREERGSRCRSRKRPGREAEHETCPGRRGGGRPARRSAASPPSTGGLSTPARRKRRAVGDGGGARLPAGRKLRRRTLFPGRRGPSFSRKLR